MPQYSTELIKMAMSTDGYNSQDGPSAQVVQVQVENANLNVKVVNRHYPSVRSILSIATYAVIYTFSPLSSGWEKSGIEGTLFVCELYPTPEGLPRYSVVVLNRRGLENFAMELLSADDVEITEEYVILQNRENSDNEPGIIGLWIFTEPPPSSTAEARAVNAQLIKACAAQAESRRG